MSNHDPIAAAVQQVSTPYQQDDNPALGASKVSTYLRCPRAYKYQYVDRLPRASSPAAALGTTIHSVIEHIHRSNWGPAQAEDVAGLLLEAWSEVRPLTADPDDPDAAKSAVEAANVWLPRYLQWREGQIDVAVEERWELPVPFTNITMRGTIDRIYRADGQNVLSDVKSGKRAPSATDLRTDLQLSVYAWAARELGLKLGRCELVMIRKGDVLEVPRDDEQIEAAMYEIVAPAAAAIATGHFPCNPSSQYGCSYCDYTATCPVGKAAVA